MAGQVGNQGNAFLGADPNQAFVTRNYPHSFFDISSKYIPTTAKEMYRWAQYVFTINPTFAQVIRKMASYVTTDLVYQCKDQAVRATWKDMLDGTLKYRRHVKRLLLDYFTYGNAFTRFIYPKMRMLECPKCSSTQQLAAMDYTFEGFRFHAKCPKCGYRGAFEVFDEPTRNRSQIKLIRIDPRFIQPIYEPVTESIEFLYAVPRQLQNRLMEGSRRKSKIQSILENVPLEVIAAVEKNQLIRFPAGSIYHFKWDSISRDDNSLGDIPFMPVFKTVWLYHTLWRAQEAVSLEHILPWTMMSPATTGGGMDPIANIRLDKWAGFMREAINRWRRDPNFIAITPFPVTAVQVRGDAKGLDNWQGLEHLSESISGGMGVPLSFMKGGSTYSGGSVELRVLENEFIGIVSQLNEFITEFVKPKLMHFYQFSAADIHHEDFKMADDIQRRQLLLALRQSGNVSERTVAAELGFDYDLEQQRIEDEMIKKARIQRTIELQNADTQAQVMLIQARAQAAAQQIMKQPAPIDPQTDDAANNAAKSEPVPFGNQGTTFTTDPAVLNLQVDNMLKTLSGDQIDQKLQAVEQSNPAYARRLRTLVERAVRTIQPAAPLSANYSRGRQGDVV